jgi:hypothetical protein
MLLPINYRHGKRNFYCDGGSKKKEPDDLKQKRENMKGLASLQQGKRKSSWSKPRAFSKRNCIPNCYENFKASLHSTPPCREGGRQERKLHPKLLWKF